MIARASQFQPLRTPKAKAKAKLPTAVERDLRFCVETRACGRVELRYFAHPQDAEGTTIRLTRGEREQLAEALARTGTHFLLRDDGGDQ